MEKKRKTIILTVIITAIVIALLGAAYAWYMHYEETSSRELVGGNIYLKLNDGADQVNLTSVMPETAQEARSHATDDNSFTFTLTGTNGSSDAVYYDILLNHGDDKAGYQRFTDNDLVFDLIELDANGDEITPYLVDAKSYGNLNKTRIYVGSVAGGVTINKTYKLRMWLSDKVLVSDTDPNRSYYATGDEAFRLHYASIKIGVYADFTDRRNMDLYNIITADAVMDNVRSTYVNSDTGIDFNAISSDTNGKGIYKRAGTENDEYPIYYYRGAVTNNNVYFANKCWKIVRTTDTGGIKLIYAGDNTGTSDAPICNNTTGATTTIMNAPFHDRYQLPAYVGYMYGDVYEWTNAKEATGAYFGTGFNYENGVYSLKGAKVGIDNTHHYTCNLTTADGTCSNIRYYYYYNSDYGDNHAELYMYITLTDGDSVLDALEKMQKNTNNSNAKTQIDNWYALNMRNYTDRLEDTIWCNDRGIYQLGGWNESGGGLTSYLYFNGVKRRDSTKIPSLECENKNDSFTVNNKKGNKMLTYPVALITSDEIMLAGGKAAENTSYYLYTGNYQWSLSPSHFSLYSALEFDVDSSGALNNYRVPGSFGLRPSVSLRLGTVITKGNGSSSNPYVIGNAY